MKLKIGFYQETSNPAITNYRGIYRNNGLLDLYYENSNNVIQGIHWYFSVSTEGNYIDYSEKNMKKMTELYKKLQKEKWDGELLLFTDNVSMQCPENFVLLGYDICADSCYYSPLGDGFLGTYNSNAIFFSEMSQIEYQSYKDNLNLSGLFSSYNMASRFSQYCNYVNDLYEHAIESERNWRPFIIYSSTKTRRRNLGGQGDGLREPFWEDREDRGRFA